MRILIGEELGGYLNYFNRLMRTILAWLSSRILLDHERVAPFSRVSSCGSLFQAFSRRLPHVFFHPTPASQAANRKAGS